MRKLILSLPLLAATAACAGASFDQQTFKDGNGQTYGSNVWKMSGGMGQDETCIGEVDVKNKLVVARECHTVNGAAPVLAGMASNIAGLAVNGIATAATQKAASAGVGVSVSQQFTTGKP